MVIILFRTSFNRGSSRYFANHGVGVRAKNIVMVDDQGNKFLKKVGETDFYAYIQSFKESVDLKSIIERCALSGDDSALNRLTGSYGDYVGLPNNLRDLENLRGCAESAYDSLPDEVKLKYSLFDFLECFTDQDKFDSLNALLSPETPIEGEVNTVES